MIAITAATGKLARGTIEYIQANYPTENVVAAARRVDALRDLDLEVREADYNRPETLKAAFRGADKVLLVSGTEFGQRIEQHSRAAQIAAEAGVGHIVYTSAPRVDSSELVFGPEHIGSEEAIRATGVAFTFLRNNWYHENYEPRMLLAKETGSFYGNANTGRVASAARQDYAEAAGVVLTTSGHENTIYELAGDTSWTYEDLADEIGVVLERPVRYENITAAAHEDRLVAAGRPRFAAEIEAGIEANIADGALAFIDGSLRKLIGHDTVPLTVAVHQILDESV